MKISKKSPTDHASRLHEYSNSITGYYRAFLWENVYLDLSSNLQLMVQALLLDHLGLGSFEVIVGWLQLAVLFLQVAERECCGCIQAPG